jgi:hypothetical protein
MNHNKINKVLYFIKLSAKIVLYILTTSKFIICNFMYFMLLIDMQKLKGFNFFTKHDSL